MIRTTDPDVGLRSGSVHCCHIPEFLVEERAVSLLSALSRSPHHDACGLVPEDEEAWAETRGTHVELAEFMSATESDRYYWMGSTRTWSYRRGQLRVDASCPLLLSEMSALLDVCEGIAGVPLGMIRIMGRQYAEGNFVTEHSENRLDRKICGHIFLTPHWDAATSGGALEVRAQTEERFTVLPVFNSLFMFDVESVRRRGVTRVTSSARRNEIQFWCYE